MPDLVAVRRGPGRVLALTYAFFTLAAGARSAVQLAEHPHDGLFAYVLSAVSAGIYASGAVLMYLAERGRFRRLAFVSCVVELAGVVVVGTLSLTRSEWFGDASVWSGYGSGYAWVPAVLPLLALWWLSTLRPSAR
jgi:hypothetical protein